MSHRLSPAARSDLKSIASTVARDGGHTAADAVVERIVQSCQFLSRNPLLGRARDDDLGEGRRSLPSGRYVIVYRRTSSGVLIQRIIDGRRDYPALFQP